MREDIAVIPRPCNIEFRDLNTEAMKYQCFYWLTRAVKLEDEAQELRDMVKGIQSWIVVQQEVVEP